VMISFPCKVAKDMAEYENAFTHRRANEPGRGGDHAGASNDIIKKKKSLKSRGGIFYEKSKAAARSFEFDQILDGRPLGDGH